MKLASWQRKWNGRFFVYTWREVRRAKSTTKKTTHTLQNTHMYQTNKKIQKQFCLQRKQLPVIRIGVKCKKKSQGILGLNKKEATGKNSNTYNIPRWWWSDSLYLPSNTSFLAFFCEKNTKLFFMLQLHFKLHFFVKCYLFIHPTSYSLPPTAIPL